MSVAFSARSGLILIPAVVEGPMGRLPIRLVLDTGATSTLLSVPILQAVGYNPAGRHVRQFVSASGGSTASLVSVSKLSALGHDRVGLPVLAHNLPATTMADGLLGLDFLRGGILTIDFNAGQITLR